MTADKATLNRGKVVFSERCARCHSSKLPEPLEGMQGRGSEKCNGPGYLACWDKYWKWTKTDNFKQKMREIVQKDDFLKGNYLSSEFRVPATLLQTNACSPLARNALAGNIWDNFSSQSYKDLPSVGDITAQDPFSGKDRTITMPAGGRGYTRPPSLVSLWSTAPFLLNNTLGPYDVLYPQTCPASDKNCRLPLGGAFKTVASAEVIFPTPFVKENNDSTRISAFVDVGNVFKNNLCSATVCSQYKNWSASELRASAGLSFQWRAPVGPIVINIAKPLKKKPGDDTEVIQFTFVNTF